MGTLLWGCAHDDLGHVSRGDVWLPALFSPPFAYPAGPRNARLQSAVVCVVALSCRQSFRSKHGGTRIKCLNALGSRGAQTARALALGLHPDRPHRGATPLVSDSASGVTG